ncbi:hypothetical protein [Roseimicrobium gellanilyticum]|nr:hypothetical protein [Roseimicrobium gellanilyticum]
MRPHVTIATVLACNVAAVVLLLGSSSSGAEPNSKSPYLPLEGERPARPQYKDQIDRFRGQLREDFFAAMTAENLNIAKLRWQVFLAVHKPGDDPAEGYEDAPHIRLVRAALYEAVRIDYHLGDETAGDALLRNIKREDGFFDALYTGGAEKEVSPPARESTEPTTSDSGRAQKEYQPLDGLVHLARNYNGPHAVEFVAATESKNLEQARARWEAFLKARPRSQAASDPSQAIYVRQAQYELVRTYYLLNLLEKGDALLKKLKHEDELFHDLYPQGAPESE